MSGIAGFLETHHRQLEAALGEVLGAAQAADWPEYRARLEALRAAVLDHIALEDEELFPQLARVLGSDAEIYALRDDHALLRQHFETLSAAAPEYDPQGCIGELEELGAFIHRHHETEVALCYPAADRLFGGNAGREQAARAITGGARSLVHAAQSGFRARPAVPALDLRGLLPPEPIVRILAVLERSPGEPLRAILPHEPVPLYTLLRERGFRYAGGSRPDGAYELLIERG